MCVCDTRLSNFTFVLCSENGLFCIQYLLLLLYRFWTWFHTKTFTLCYVLASQLSNQLYFAKSCLTLMFGTAEIISMMKFHISVSFSIVCLLYFLVSPCLRRIQMYLVVVFFSFSTYFLVSCKATTFIILHLYIYLYFKCRCYYCSYLTFFKTKLTKLFGEWRIWYFFIWFFLFCFSLFRFSLHWTFIVRSLDFIIVTYQPFWLITQL